MRHRLLLTLVWLLPTFFAATGSAVAASGFSVVSPPAGFENATPTAVDATGPPSVVWVVGYVPTDTGAAPFVARGHDGAWEIPILPIGRGELDDVDALSGHDVWAVGRTGRVHRRGLILAWNGATWSSVPTPPRSIAILKISRRSPTDAYALDIKPNPDCVDFRLSHWDGVAWTRLSVQRQCEDGPSFGDLAAIRGGPVIMPGHLLRHEERFTSPVWACFRTGCPTPPELPADPTPAGGAWLAAAGTARSDIWALGAADIDSSPSGNTIVAEHWNGTSWTTLQTPPYVTRHDVAAVTEVSSTSAWAVGARFTSSGWRTLIVHVTAAGIEDLGGPNPSLVADELDDIVHVPGTLSEMWAVGSTDTGQLLLHHD
jgi:hypothetical protein